MHNKNSQICQGKHYYNRLYIAHIRSWVNVLLMAGLTMCAGLISRAEAAPEPALKVLPPPLPEKRQLTKKTPEAMPFYIYNNSILPPVKNFCPSGYMGDIPDIAVAGSYDQLLREDSPAIKIIYAAQGYAGWGGVMWQNPPNNWGESDGGYNLSNAKKLTFWARGDKGGEVVDFKVGGIGGGYPDSDIRILNAVILTTAWKQYTIDLSTARIFYLSGGFGFSFNKAKNPNGCVFYLDDIKFE